MSNVGFLTFTLTKYLNDKLLTKLFLTFVFVTIIVARLGYLQLFHVRNFMALSLESDPLSELMFGNFVF